MVSRHRLGDTALFDRFLNGMIDTVTRGDGRMNKRKFHYILSGEDPKVAASLHQGTSRGASRE